MKSLLLIALSLAFLSCTSLDSSYQNYPDYTEVVERFFETYDVSGLDENPDVQFRKNRYGWSVAVRKFNRESYEYEDILELVYWIKEPGEYLDLDLKWRSDGDITSDKQQLLTDHSIYYYDLLPYYGYPGWTEDVIGLLDNVRGLSDTLQFALAYAYSSHASDLLHNNSGLALKNNEFNLDPRRNSMTDDQLRTYREYRHKAIELFEDLAHSSPEYNTYVGQISIKAANERMNSFLDLWTYSNYKEAKSELVDGLYDEFMTTMAINYLQSCDENAILFTNGDNDTYPLLYAQHQLGIREDVAVVNLSLLNTGSYVNAVRGGSRGVDISFPANMLEKSLRDIIVLDESSEPMDLCECVDFVRTDENLKPYGEAEYYSMPSNIARIQKPKQLGVSADDGILWEFGSYYIMRNQLMVMDIICENDWKRPIYFAQSVGADGMYNLTSNLESHGLALKLVPESIKPASHRTGRMNAERFYDNFTTRFQFPSNLDDFLVGRNTVRMALSIRLTTSYAIEDFIDTGSMDKAAELCELILEAYPDPYFPWGQEGIIYSELHFELGKTEQAMHIAKASFLYFHKAYSKSLKGAELSEEEEYRSGLAPAVYDRFQILAEMFEVTELTKFLDEHRFNYE